MNVPNIQEISNFVSVATDTLVLEAAFQIFCFSATMK